MTRQETGVIMDILATAYPRFYGGNDAPDPRKAVTLWAEMFHDDPVELVAAAVKALIVTDERGFPPHIGAVKAQMRKIMQPDEPTEQEAWALVLGALKRGIYESKAAFDALPETVRRVVGSANQLREWAVMDSETVQSIVASNFQRSYRERARREREFAALPSDVQKLARRLETAMTLKALEGGAE